MSAPYAFGLSQEDERTEAAALRIVPTDRVLCVASGGEMPLSLLAMGVERVVAVDVSAAQLHLTALKLAAIERLEPDAALRLLGYLPARAEERRRLWREVRPALDANAQRFWEANDGAVRAAPIWAGRYERYARLLRLGIGPLVGRRHLEALFGATTLDEQREAFVRHIDRPALRALFRVAFHPRLFRKRGMDPRSLAHRDDGRSLGEQYFAQLRQACTATLAADNPLLQLHLLGRLISAEAAPLCFRRCGVEVIRARRARLTLRRGDLSCELDQQPPGAFNKVHLSNVTDWLAAADWTRLLGLLAARVAKGGRVVWRCIHVDRPLPAELAAALRVDGALGQELAARDRFPFYRIIPAEIAA